MSFFERLRHVQPETLRAWSGRVAPAFGWAAMALLVAGLALGLALAPADPLHGNPFRVAVLHFPAAWLSVAIYLAIGALGIATLARASAVSGLVASALAPTGMLFTLLALWTEALWRKPLRGLWWVWDAESISQLLLLFLFGGFIAIKSMIDDPRRGERAGALLAVLGAANLPVLYFSLHWWDVLRHEVERAVSPPMNGLTAAATALVAAGFAAYAAFAACKRVRCLVAEREALARSMRRLQEQPA